MSARAADGARVNERPESPARTPSLTGVRIVAALGAIVAVVAAVGAFVVAWPLGVLVVFLSPGFPLVAVVGFDALRGE